MEKYTILDKKNSITIDKNGIKKYKYLIQIKCNDLWKYPTKKKNSYL